MGFEDASGGGTLFRVDLPVWAQASGHGYGAGEIDHLPRQAVAKNQRGLPKILHVDDDHDALDAVAEALRGIARVVSVDTVEGARREIAAAQQHFAGLRRYGAATLDLAWIAAGRLDAYWERNLSPWDLAAGILLVREAGGFVAYADGGDAILANGSVVAGNDTMHRELLRLLR